MAEALTLEAVLRTAQQRCFDEYVQPLVPDTTFQEFAEAHGLIEPGHILPPAPVEPSPTVEPGEVTPDTAETPPVNWDAELRALLDPAPAPPTKVVKPEARGVRIGRVIGTVALLTGLAVGGLVGSSAASEKIMEWRTNPTTDISIGTTPTEVTESPVTTAPETSQSSVPTPETTTPPPPPFEVGPGEVVGSINIPRLCQDIQIVEMEGREMELVGETKKRGLPNGAVKLDLLTRDPTPSGECAPVNEYAASRPGFVPRSQSLKASAIGEGNPYGEIDYWQPIIAHENTGGPTSVYPGQVGISKNWGHRTTYSAPLKDIETLQPGDPAYVTRADGHNYELRFTEHLIIDPANADYALNEYYDQKVKEALARGESGNIRMTTIAGCSDGNGNSGGDEARIVAVFVNA